jgi:hypothetical protein
MRGADFPPRRLLAGALEVEGDALRLNPASLDGAAVGIDRPLVRAAHLLDVELESGSIESHGAGAEAAGDACRGDDGRCALTYRLACSQCCSPNLTVVLA